jgi:DNA-directed RNA polymerase specialized sigma24 family protein
MRKWIKQKVSAALKDTYKPKMDDYLPELSIQDKSYDHTEKQIMELAEELLDGEYLEVFKLKLFEDKTLEQISKIVGKSIDTCKRRYDKALRIIKKHVEKEDSGYIK